MNPCRKSPAPVCQSKPSCVWVANAKTPHCRSKAKTTTTTTIMQQQKTNVHQLRQIKDLQTSLLKTTAAVTALQQRITKLQQRVAVLSTTTTAKVMAPSPSVGVVGPPRRPPLPFLAQIGKSKKTSSLSVSSSSSQSPPKTKTHAPAKLPFLHQLQHGKKKLLPVSKPLKPAKTPTTQNPMMTHLKQALMKRRKALQKQK